MNPQTKINRYRPAYIIGYLISIGLFPWLIMGPYGSFFENDLLRIALICGLSTGSGWLFKRIWSQRSWGEAVLFTFLAYGTVYKIVSFIPDISTYPFSLGWSEASRYYYASLFFAKRIYGASTPASVLHPSRYMMQSLPFLIPTLPLWFHRLWQVLLWLVFTGTTALLLTTRVTSSITGGATATSNGSSGMTRWAFGAWAFLFLFQGPVYYHLLVMVILVLWGFDSGRLWRSTLVVLIASLWAGISRVNWLPVPGLLAAALYLLDKRAGRQPLWRYLAPPALWTVAGSAVALISQQAYVFWSGNPSEQFGSSLTSDLLWYRLFPNVTYRIGILPSIALVSLPLLALMALRIYPLLRDFHPVRWLGLGAILSVLFVGGTVVSVKIGGGSNLHNLDAYLVLCLVICSSIYFGRFQLETGKQESHHQPHWLLVSAAVAIPVVFAITSGGPLPQRDMCTAQAHLQTIKEAVRQTHQGGGEVLFITQRHLLTFHTIEDVPLIPDYELVFLMEMAMSGNQSYLDSFHRDLHDRRYAMIVSEPLKIMYQGRAHSFGEENDSWVSRVSEPVLCYYEPLMTLDEINVQLLVPRATPCE